MVHITTITIMVKSDLSQGLPTGKKKKSRKYDDYVDLGAGYDETDPFIDNTDAVRFSIHAR